MAKRAKNKSTKQPKSRRPAPLPRRTRRPGGIRVSGLDAGAIAHRNLLLDPCNASLGAPVYSGLGTGQYRRLRVIIAAEGNSVEGCYVFQLGTNSYWKASHVAGSSTTPYVFSSVQHIFQDGMISQTGVQLRCVAGCVKVRYVGAESARKGTIGLLAAPSSYQSPSFTSQAEIDTTVCPVVHRTGEVQHEVKFVPNASDETFRSPTVFMGAQNQTAFNSTLVVAYRACEPQTLQFEVTAVYEVETVGNDNVITTVAPSSSITLNQLMRSMGPVASWAYGTVVAPTLRAMAGKPGNTILSSVVAASRAVAALTL